MNDYSFIKNFTSITISNICKKYNINAGNLLSGNTTEENYKKVKEELINELFKLFIKENEKKESIMILYLYNEILEKLEKENKMLREMI